MSATTTTTTTSVAKMRLAPSGYTHKVDPYTVLWLFVSLILVFWDTCYIFLRPLSMPGGKYHSPIWTPYALYGTVDYIYGWPAWNDGVGFTAAQGALNVVESSMYAYYLYTLLRRGKGSGWFQVWDAKYYGRKIVVQGDDLALAVVTVFSAAVMTVSKTVLYCKSSLLKQHRHQSWFPYKKCLLTQIYRAE
jgi:hypothetical protein